MLIDTHAHLDDRRFNKDRDKVIERAKKAGVSNIIHVGFDERSSKEAVKMANKYEEIYAVVGVHPHDSKKASDSTMEEIYNLAKNEDKVLAVGEMGLDYFKNYSPRQTQQKVFRTQISLAKQLDLPIVIHDRDAHQDILKIMKEEGARMVGGVLHCYSGSWEIAKECINMGFFISFAGPVTYSNARRLRDVVKQVPIEKLLIETDCPYLTPEPYRGDRNEPAYVKHVAERISEIKGMDFDIIAEKTTENAKEVFRIKN